MYSARADLFRLVLPFVEFDLILLELVSQIAIRFARFPMRLCCRRIIGDRSCSDVRNQLLLSAVKAVGTSPILLLFVQDFLVARCAQELIDEIALALTVLQ